MLSPDESWRLFTGKGLGNRENLVGLKKWAPRCRSAPWSRKTSRRQSGHHCRLSRHRSFDGTLL